PRGWWPAGRPVCLRARALRRDPLRSAGRRALDTPCRPRWQPYPRADRRSGDLAGIPGGRSLAGIWRLLGVHPGAALRRGPPRAGAGPGTAGYFPVPGAGYPLVLPVGGEPDLSRLLGG